MDVVLMSTYLITSGRCRLSPFPQGGGIDYLSSSEDCSGRPYSVPIGWRPEHCVKAGLQHSGAVLRHT